MALTMFRVGLAVTDTVANIITLSIPPATTTLYYQSLCQPNGSGGWPVPANKNFYLTRLIITPGAANGGIGEIGFGSGAVANSVTRPPGFGWTLGVGGGFLFPTANSTVSLDVFLIFSASQYPVVQVVGANTLVTAIGVYF